MALVVVVVRSTLVVLALVLALSTNVHRVVSALREPILRRSIVGDDGAEYSTLVVLGDAANDNAVGAGRTAVVDTAGVGDGELEVWLLSVGEAKVLVVVVDVGVYSIKSVAVLARKGPIDTHICPCLSSVSEQVRTL